MSNHSEIPEPEPLFAGAIRGGGLVVAVLFRCGVCNALAVDAPGEVCSSCTPAKPAKTRARRSLPAKTVTRGERR